VASYSVFIKPSAVRELEALPVRDRRRLADQVRALASKPRPSGVRKITGRDRYRVRQGDYRIVYEVDDAALTVTVFKIGHRRDVYR
jgi:mRNA interferase RelE/StbE